MWTRRSSTSSSYRRLVTQLYALVGDHEEAQDCVQEALAQAWVRRRALVRDQHPEAWVRTTAYRLAVTRWRRVRRDDRFRDRALARPESVAAPTEDHVALVAALRAVPEAQRRTLVLHYVAGLTVREIAAETGVAEGTVKARLSRGRVALAGLLGEPEPVEGAGHG